MMKKKILIIAIVVIDLAAAVTAGVFAHSHSTEREARLTFNNEFKALTSENKQLEKTKNELKNSLSETEQNIENKNVASLEAEEYSVRLENLKQEVANANRTITELDETIRQKNEYIEKTKNIKNQTFGNSFSTSDKTYECPDGILAGRYIVEGSGNLLIYNSSEKLRISENLSMLDTNSFTFDIEEGESVKVTDSVTFTAIK